MQINFSAKKLKEAKKYVNLLNPPKVKMPKELQSKNKKSFFRKLLNTLFK